MISEKRNDFDEQVRVGNQVSVYEAKEILREAEVRLRQYRETVELMQGPSIKAKVFLKNFYLVKKRPEYGYMEFNRSIGSDSHTVHCTEAEMNTFREHEYYEVELKLENYHHQQT
jgi:hypothetical protein